MKFFQKRGVAIAVLILAIVASSAWGLHKAPAVSTPEGGEKLDPSLSAAAFTQYVRDDAAAADLAVAAEAASAEDAEKPKPLTQNEKHVCLAGVLFLTLIAA